MSYCTGSTVGFILHRINSGLHTAQGSTVGFILNKDQQWASCCTGSSELHAGQGSTVGFMLDRIKWASCWTGINSGLHAAQDQVGFMLDRINSGLVGINAVQKGNEADFCDMNECINFPYMNK